MEQGTRPWFKSWNAEHAAGRITRPLRANGIPYRGINVLMLWAEAESKGYAAPIWITYKQAIDCGAHVRKGEQGSLVVYASKTTRTEVDTVTGDETERDIPFLKGYTVFNVEQVEGLPAQYYATAAKTLDCQSALDWAPGSAFKRDPFDRRGLAVALAPTEPVRVAEAARARLSGRSSSRLLKRQLSLPVSTISQ